MIMSEQLPDYPMDYVKVEGEDCGDLVLYALSTCMWCKKTKQLLDEMNVAHRYLYVDLLDKDAKKEAMMEMAKHNNSGSFPLIVIDGEDTILGFKEEEIRRLSKR